MAWIFAGVLVVLLSGLVVLLVVSPGLRMFCFGAVCMLGVVGVLLYRCSDLITSAALLDYIPLCQLEFSENRDTFLLGLTENMLGLCENNLITSGSARIK